MKNESETLQVGLFASFPSKSRTGYVAQTFFLFPGILVGYLFMYLASLFFEVDLFRYTIWVVIISCCLVRELVAGAMPEVFELTVQRNKRDVLIVTGSYLLSIIVLTLGQPYLPANQFWNEVFAFLLTIVSIYLPVILFGSAELKAAILPVKRGVRNP